jgi:hypothetical protein
LAGIVGFDFLNDDLARTRGLKLDAVENKLLIDLWKVRSSKATLAAYLDAKPWRAPSDRIHEPAVPDRYPAGTAGELPASGLPSPESFPQTGPSPASPALPE